MTDNVYDISHFEIEHRRADAPAPRFARPVVAAVSRPVQPSVEAAQEALARELMQSATIHDAMVQQYLGMSDAVCQAAHD